MITDPAIDDRVHSSATHLYDAECALHAAHQTHVDAWIAAAADKLHRAVAAHLAAIAAQQASPDSKPVTPSRRAHPAEHTSEGAAMTTMSTTAWPDTRDKEPPAGNLYRSAAWLLGRHPRLARLAAGVHGVVVIDDGGPSIDLDHLADVLSASAPYATAWGDYERRHRAPGDGGDDTWLDAGPKPDDFAEDLSDFLAMSGGEIASLRLLATLASTDSVPPFGLAHMHSLDAEGQRLVADWCAAVRAY